MKRGHALRERDAGRPRISIVGGLRASYLDLSGGGRKGGFQLGAMHFHLPLQIREFVLLVGPHRRIQFEPADNRDYFLAVGHSAGTHVLRHGHERRRTKIIRAERGAALRADRSGEKTRRPLRRTVILRAAFQARRISLLLALLGGIFPSAQNDTRRFTAIRGIITGFGLRATFRADVSVAAQPNPVFLEQQFLSPAKALPVGYV